MITDAQGHTVSDATAEAVRLYDEGVRAFNLGYGDAPGGLDAAIEAAPQCAMAHLAKAWLFALSNDPMVLGNARPLVEAAAGLTLNEREQTILLECAPYALEMANRIRRDRGRFEEPALIFRFPP